MTAQQPPTPRRDWRTDLETDTLKAAGPRWHVDPEATLPRHRRKSRALRFLLAGVFLVALFLALLWVILWLQPPKGTAVLLVTADYLDNLAVPHNVYGREGARALADLARAEGATGETGRLKLPYPPQQLANVDDWDQALGRVDERTILLFLALHGGVDAQGGYLLPQNAWLPLDPASLDADKSRLYLTGRAEGKKTKSILERLKEVPPYQKIVLVLDATQAPSNWAQGVLANTLAHELDRLNEEIAEIPNLVVLSASDVGQRSWVCEDLRRTIFTHYVIEGLKGHADGAVDGITDSQVDAGELFQYVQTKVESWIRANRGALQTPALWPRGDQGLARARGIHLTVAAPDPPPEETPGPVFEPTDALKSEWQKFAALNREVPSPAVYSPHLWRRYRELLLRYESLLQAGDAEAARTFPARLFELAQAIRQDRSLGLGSAGNTLAMQAVGGLESPPGAKASQALNELWDAPPAENGKRWADLLAKSGVPTLRLQVLRLLVGRVIEDPVKNLDRAAKLAIVLDDPLSPRPAEVHDVVMFQRDLPRDINGAPLLPGKDLELALRTRLRGERAALGLPSEDQVVPTDAPYPYCAEVVPWIRTRVAEGDKQRRLGHDFLLTSDPESWDKGAKLLEQADALYRQAQEDALRVRAALAARDEALSVLPYYAHWLARRSLAEANPRQHEDGQLLERVDRLIGDAHALSPLLEKRDANSGGDLTEQAKAVRRELKELEDEFSRYLKMADDPDTTAVLWRALDDVLVVPMTDAEQRAYLLDRKAKLSRRLFNDTDRNADAAGPTAKKTEEIVRKSAEVQGRLALSLLGKRWFEEAGGLQSETWAQTLRRLDGFVSAEKWWLSADRASEEIGTRWRQLPPEIVKHLDQGQKVPPPRGATDLQAADRLVRLVNASGSLFLSRNPAVAYRRLLVQDLLLDQTNRTLADHWASEDALKTPYYRSSGRAYVDDLRRIDSRYEQLKEAEQKLQQEWKLELKLDSAPGYRGPASGDPAVLAMTSEDEFPLQYILAAEGKPVAPLGRPVVWVEAGPNLKAFAPVAGRRSAREVTGAPDPLLRCLVAAPMLRQVELKPPDVPTTIETFFTVQGLYRGQPFALKTPLDLHPLAETVVHEYPLPLTGSLAVRSPRGLQAEVGSAKGAVAIILDCSGSMAAPPGQPPTSSKYAEAVDALRDLLSRVPRGTVVSVWVFGQSMGDDAKPPPAEDTIERVLDPTPWNPQDPGRLNDVLTRISALRPWNESPVVRAMWRAAREDLARADGFKTLLVITDGIDNRFATDVYLNRDRKDLRTFLLDNFRDIEVDVIAFKVANGEGAKVREQFQVVAELPVPGKLYTVEEARDLSLKMRQVFRPQLSYRIDRDDGEPVTGADGVPLDISLTGANDRWLPGGLSPGSYRLRLMNPTAGREMILNRGDALLAEVIQDRAGLLAFRRVLYSEADHGLAPAKEESFWRLACLQNQLVNDRRLEMLLTLEKKGELLAGPLRQVRPAKVWLEIAPPPDVAGRFHRSWHYHAGYPAPAWGYQAPVWPLGQLTKSPATPQVRVWWQPEDVPGRGTLLVWRYDASGQRAPTNQPVTASGSEVIVESVRVEHHLVETQPAFRDRPARRELKPCLVVRTRNAKDSPIWVRLRGVEVAGQEHRYYSAAGKYTALFWPVTADQAELGLSGLEVFSVPAFKAEAQKAGYRIEMLDLYEPQAGDTRPLEPVELRLPDDLGGMHNLPPAALPSHSSAPGR